MAEYYVMLERKYEIPAEQYVIYLGATKPQMSTQLESNWMKFTFRLISFADLDYHIFLKSIRPEEVVLGVLADFKGDSPEKALAQIIQRIEETTTSNFPLERYFKQLRVLAQLRNLSNNLKDIAMDNIPNFVSIEKDAAYLVGLDKGEEKVVGSLLKKLNYSLEQIADIAGVSVEFVKKVKQNLSADN